MAKTKAHPQQLNLNRALITAAATTAVLKVKSALEFGADIDFQDGDQCGWSAIHFSCYFSSTDKSAERVCKLLISSGADLNLKANDGATPLFTAASVGSLEVVRLLITNRCQLDLTDKAGWTPLMGAVDRGSLDIVDLLIGSGADIALKNNKGLTAIDIANNRGFYNIVSRIEEAILLSDYSERSKQRVGF